VKRLRANGTDGARKRCRAGAQKRADPQRAYFFGLLNQFASIKNRARNHKINRIW
jgi:hypothetical protein